MNWIGSKVKLEVFAPDLQTPITRPVDAKISEDRAEFNDVSFTDIQGDPYSVVAAKIDITDARVSYKTLQSGSFANVNDDTGFNGYVFSFKALGVDSGARLHAAELVAGKTTLDIDPSNIVFSDRKLFINVDGLIFDHADTMMIDLGFALEGTRGKDRIAGMNGSDLLWGGAGADRLSGSRGADTFEFRNASESVRKAYDTILDFNRKQGDIIDVGQMLSEEVSDRFDFIGGDRFSAGGAAEIRYEFRSGDTLIRADIDGNGTTDFFLELDGRHDLRARDFVLELPATTGSDWA